MRALRQKRTFGVHEHRLSVVRGLRGNVEEQALHDLLEQLVDQGVLGLY